MSTDALSKSSLREIRTRGPRPDADALRTAYLGLLKLCLCDLTGASTREFRWTGDRRVFSRELTDDEQVRRRAEGKDWTLDGLTMVGLTRLDDLQACVESIVRDGVEGDLIEAGAWRGGASILIRATLDSLGADERTLWVADSFQGFPAPEQQGGVSADRDLESHLSTIDFLAPSLEDVRGYFARFGCEAGVRFVPGFFEDTMAGLRGRRWSLVRVDADTYSATKLTLEALYPGLAVGGYLVLDDYFHPFLAEACKKAVDDFRHQHRITEPIEQIDWNGGRWRRETAAPGALEQAPDMGARRPPADSRRVAGQRTTSRVPTDRELQLGDELATVRMRLHAVEAELHALKSSPFRAAARSARRRIRRRS